MIIRFAYLHDTVDYLLSRINKYRNQQLQCDIQENMQVNDIKKFITINMNQVIHLYLLFYIIFYIQKILYFSF